MNPLQQLSNMNFKRMNSNLSTVLSDVFAENIFSDVTLVSDDQIPLHAHKYVLSAFSPVLKNMILNNPHPHPLIFLRGLNHQDLLSILNFIYLGMASINHNNFGTFFEAAKELEIKQLENIRIMKKEPEPSEDDIDNDEGISYLAGTKDWENIHCKSETNFLSGEGSDSSTDKHLYKCKECEAIFKQKRGLFVHISAKHEGILYSCKYCDYRATQQGSLKIHQESIHQGVKYSCNQCDYKASRKDTLKSHKKVVHEGIRYSCNQCDFQFTQHGHLKRHQKSTHDGVKYSCGQCNHQTGRKDELKKHEEVKHLVF